MSVGSVNKNNTTSRYLIQLNSEQATDNIQTPLARAKSLKELDFSPLLSL